MDWWQNHRELSLEEIEKNIAKEVKVLKILCIVGGNDVDKNIKIIMASKKEWMERDKIGWIWDMIVDGLNVEYIE